jgi:hypothetical protein
MSARDTLKQLNLLFLALAGGQVLFCMLVAYMLSSGLYRAEPSGLPFDLLAPLILIGTAALAYLLDKRLSENGKAQPGLDNKALQYRTAAIIRLAVLEAGNLILVLAALLEGRLQFLLYFAIGLLIFFFFRPSRDNFVASFELSESEQKEL